MTLAHSSEGGGLAAAFHYACLRWGGVHLAFGAADGDFGAAFRVAGFAGGSVLRTHAGTLAALGASREAALTTLGPVRDADAALNDAVFAAGDRTCTLVPF